MQWEIQVGAGAAVTADVAFLRGMALPPSVRRRCGEVIIELQSWTKWCGLKQLIHRWQDSSATFS